MTKDKFFDLFGQINSSYILAVEDVLNGRGKAINFHRKRIARQKVHCASSSRFVAKARKFR